MTKSLTRQLTWNNMEIGSDGEGSIPNGTTPKEPHHGILIKESSLIKEPSMPGILTKSDSYARFLAANQNRRRSTLLTHTYTNVKVSYWATDPYAK